MTTLVLTFMGEDRPGLVDSLSGVVARHGGNWERSSMAHLGSKFAGVLEVSVAEGGVDALGAGLQALGAEAGLSITVDRATPELESRYRRLHLDIVGQDRPGIVHDISHALAERGISIERLDTETISASMSGGTLFQAEAVLRAPDTLAMDDLVTALETLANELMVDVDVEEDET
ncbi:MAG: ACT domain-containing protein [Ectothiorhodospiraceae bacterium]|nr:ACT domain-containing protein [Ectothiorhodospiraceae bacterium]